MKRGVFVLVATALLVWGVAATVGLRALGHIVRRAESSANAPSPPSRENRPSAPKPLALEEKAIQSATPSGYRPATSLDSEETPERQDLENLYLEYQPYFVRGDVNGDGVLDFVTAYVAESGEAPVFDIAVFLGQPGGTFSEPQFIERGTALSFGDLSIDRSIVVITPDLKTELTRRYRHVNGTFEDVDGNSPADPGPDRSDDPPEESLDHRVRVRT